MKTPFGLKTLLLLTGLIGIGIGGAILFEPIAFHATSGIAVPGDENLLSELRAAGGALLAIGLVVVLGAFVSRLTFTALILATVLYLSYGVSRVTSMILDGLPSSTLLAVTAFELGVGLVCAITLIKYRSPGSPDGKLVS
eukprot:s1_g1378.t1